MARKTREDLRNILSNMEKGKGYRDFNKIEVCFDNYGNFKIYHNGHLNHSTQSMKDAVERIFTWLN